MFCKRKTPNTKYSLNKVRGRQIPNTFKAGTALLMTILILNSILLISLAAAKLIVTGVKEGGTQARSTKAYFAAEAGAERMLYEYRQGSNTCGVPGYATSTCSFVETLSDGSSYLVYWKSGDYDFGNTLVFVSVGTYPQTNGLKRSVELDFDY
ncbi:MAG: hypothetical protein PHE24_05665 [Patescibacteria group bacterium]|nr:hypothetical protein [Patescibacteria group bacterium]